MLLNFRSCAVFVSKATSVFGRDSWRNIVWSVSNSSGSFTLGFGTDRVDESTIVNTLDISRGNVPLGGFINSFHFSSTCICEISRKHRLIRGCKKIEDPRYTRTLFYLVGLEFCFRYVRNQSVLRSKRRTFLKGTSITNTWLFLVFPSVRLRTRKWLHSIDFWRSTWNEEILHRKRYKFQQKRRRVTHEWIYEFLLSFSTYFSKHLVFGNTERMVNEAVLIPPQIRGIGPDFFFSGLQSKNTWTGRRSSGKTNVSTSLLAAHVGVSLRLYLVSSFGSWQIATVAARTVRHENCRCNKLCILTSSRAAGFVIVASLPP